MMRFKHIEVEKQSGVSQSCNTVNIVSHCYRFTKKTYEDVLTTNSLEILQVLVLNVTHVIKNVTF